MSDQRTICTSWLTLFLLWLFIRTVPAEVADEELFWLRYYYRLFEIEEEEKRRKKLVQGMLFLPRSRLSYTNAFYL